ncbi:MAG: universal stress protein [Candidatus Sumerlaeia bacterium]
MFTHILVPLEHSEIDEVILDFIRPLARLAGSRITLIHVADGFAARQFEHLNLAESEEMRADRAYLEQQRRRLEDEGFETDCVLALGDPVEQIVAAAAEGGCDLIAMATHGHRFVKDVILGSVASPVRHKTDVPVLLVRATRERLEAARASKK